MKALQRGAFAGALGVLIGMVGLDPMTAEGRFTFNTITLMGGIPYVVAMIGFFGVAEAFVQLHGLNKPVIKQKIDRIIPHFSDVKLYFWLALRASGIGTIIGALPGTGEILLLFWRMTTPSAQPRIPKCRLARERRKD